MAPPRQVVLEREQLEQFWKEQRVVAETMVDPSIRQFEECLQLQSKILKHFFGVLLKVKDEVKQEVENTKKPSKKSAKEIKKEKIPEEDLDKTQVNEVAVEKKQEKNNSLEEHLLEKDYDDMDISESRLEIDEDTENDEKEKGTKKSVRKSNKEKNIKPELAKTEANEVAVEVKKEQEQINFYSLEEHNLDNDYDDMDIKEDLIENTLEIDEETKTKLSPVKETSEENESKPNLSPNKPFRQVYCFPPTNGNKEELKTNIKKEIKPDPEPQFTCTFCQSEQFSYKMLKSHVEEVHLGLDYHCNICKFTSNDKDMSNDHMALAHRGEENMRELKFGCGLCEFRGELKEHSDHIILHHPEYSDFLFDDIDDNVSVKEEKFVAKVERDEDDRWPCSVCGFRAADKHTLRVHVEMNHLNIRYECVVCSLSTKELYIVRGHVVKVHGDDRDDLHNLHYCCGLCGFKGERNDFLDHIREEHVDFWVYYENYGRTKSMGREGRQKGECDYCHANLASNLKSHVETAHMLVRYTCSSEGCGHRSRVRKAAMEHLEMVHLATSLREEGGRVGLEGRHWIRQNLRYSCGQCDKLLARFGELVNHMTTEHREAIVMTPKEPPCSKCGMVFEDRAARSEHMLLHKAGGARVETSCKSCDHTSSTESNLRVHIMMRHMTARFTCKSCRKQFKFPSECRSHIKKFHQGTNDGMECTCNKCGITSADYSDFMKHAVAEHSMPQHGRRPPTHRPATVAPRPQPLAGTTYCTYCDFSSTTKSDVRVHMDLLHTRATHSCGLCGAAAGTKAEVVRHMRTEHEEQFSVDLVASSLLLHCAACPAVASKADFLAHLAGHTEGQTALGKGEVEEAARYSCTRCPTFQADKASTINHILGEHMGEVEEGGGLQEHVSGLLLMSCSFCTFRGSIVAFYSHTASCLERMVPFASPPSTSSFSLPSDECSCTFCGAVCSDARSVNSHVMFSHMRVGQTCSICDIKLRTKAIMYKHMSEEHSQEKVATTVMVQCGLCSFKSTSGEFGQHMGANHRAEMELEAVQHPKCNQCDFTAPTSNKLSQHMKSVHEQFKCDLCDTEEVFVTKKKLGQHHMHNHQDWTFNCELECGFSTKHRTALARHKLVVHDRVRKFTCDVAGCERDFTRKDYLLMHTRKDHSTT